MQRKICNSGRVIMKNLKPWKNPSHPHSTIELKQLRTWYVDKNCKQPLSKLDRNPTIPAAFVHPAA